MTRNIKDSGIDWIGAIPKDWEITKLKNILIEKKEKNDSDDPIVLSLARSGIKVRDISNNEGQLAESYLNYNKVSYGDLLLNPMDLVSGANCNIAEVEGVISPAYFNLNPINRNNIYYYGYYFKLQYWHMVLFAHGKGVSFENRWTLNRESLLNYVLPVPPSYKQKDIAYFLDEKTQEIDNIISKTKKAIEYYKKYKQSFITETVTNGLDKNVRMKDSGIEWIGNIPEHWEVIRLGFLGRLQNGINKAGEEFGFGFPFINYGDVYRNYQLDKSEFSGLVNSTEKERENYSVKKGDVLFTRTSEIKEEIGYAATCLGSIENAVFTGFAIRFRPFKKSRLYPGFSKYYFRSEIHRKYFVKEMNIVTRVSLGQELLMKLSVLLPPLDEQEKISTYLNGKCGEIDNIISKKEKLLEEMEAYKRSLIYETVTGKREVR